MAQVELIMPKMGESIIEATILNWVKKVGDHVSVDETVLEIATDKVDSEIPSPVEGTIVKILHEVDTVVEIGKPIAIIATEGGDIVESPPPAIVEKAPDRANVPNNSSEQQPKIAAQNQTEISSSPNRFYSPLVKNIAIQEGVSQSELDQIPGTGLNSRVTKSDILQYITEKSTAQPTTPTATLATEKKAPSTTSQPPSSSMNVGEREELIEMGRMRKMIANHMVNSKHTSPHVTSFIEVDVTNIVQWREKIKRDFQKKYHEKITYTPIFMEAVCRAIHDFPFVNVSVKDDKILKKNYINLGMATALPSGDLIVPVIKDADNLSLLGLTKKVNDLANRARDNKLTADEIQGGTFTVTNVGTFGNVMGTPIINQPQAAILAIGAIRKKPAVIETEYGDVIAIRQMMFLSLSYDHRVVDGFLGGSFLKRVGDYLEDFDHTQTI